jgi:hypothetical protein
MAGCEVIASLVEMLHRDNDDLHSTNESGSNWLSVPMLHAGAHNLLYVGVYSSCIVCAGVCEGVSIESYNERCHIDIWSIDD